VSVAVRRDQDGTKAEPAAASVLAEGAFRANPRYELVLLDRLSASERELLGGLQAEDLYGVLRAREGEGPEPRSVTSETALLFLSLGEPGALPAYVRARLGDELERTVARLVLDDVLEIEHEGRFICGSEAAACVLAGRSSGGRGRIGELSVAALRYGQELVGLPQGELALRLYGYGRRPLTPALASRLGEGAALAAYLGVQAGGPARAALDDGWVETTSGKRGAPAGARVYWRSWRARWASGGSSTAHKLYVSPALGALPRVLEVVAGSLAGVRGVQAFKFGAELRDLCRADKLVVYFERLDDLQNAAVKLEQRLGACPAHGVPFTAAVTADGLLSWGVDPPALAGDRGELTSWRLWVSERLAEYLAIGAADDSRTLEPWQFALERLRLAGIDTDTWVPASGMWREAHASA
jgi:hypothetical protein